MNEGAAPADDKAPTGSNTALLEAYGLMYTDFDTEGDVLILDADTTEIAVSKQRAAYDTMMIWSRAYGKNVTGRENWDNMVVDFNAHINDIYQIARSGIEIK